MIQYIIKFESTSMFTWFWRALSRSEFTICRYCQSQVPQQGQVIVRPSAKWRSKMLSECSLDISFCMYTNSTRGRYLFWLLAKLSTQSLNKFMVLFAYPSIRGWKTMLNWQEFRPFWNDFWKWVNCGLLFDIMDVAIPSNFTISFKYDLA